jgi:hypothetical protein
MTCAVSVAACPETATSRLMVSATNPGSSRLNTRDCQANRVPVRVATRTGTRSSLGIRPRRGERDFSWARWKSPARGARAHWSSSVGRQEAIAAPCARREWHRSSSHPRRKAGHLVAPCTRIGALKTRPGKSDLTVLRRPCPLAPRSSPFGETSDLDAGSRYNLLIQKDLPSFTQE